MNGKPFIQQICNESFDVLSVVLDDESLVSVTHRILFLLKLIVYWGEQNDNK